MLLLRHGWRTFPLRLASKRFDKPASILSDNDSCFVGQGGRRKEPTGRWQSTVFEEELLGNGIVLTNSGPCHPQTNGKLESSTTAGRIRFGTMGARGHTSATTTRHGHTFPPILTTTRCP